VSLQQDSKQLNLPEEVLHLQHHVDDLVRGAVLELFLKVEKKINENQEPILQRQQCKIYNATNSTARFCIKTIFPNLKSASLLQSCDQTIL
jgi:hypothetical protein